MSNDIVEVPFNGSMMIAQRFDDGEIYTAGSSPHVRGAQENQGHHWWCRGIIPACAGSTGWV